MAKVVITGAGVASPIGTGMDEFMSGIREGRKGIDRIKNFDTEYFATNYGAEVRKGGEIVKTGQGTDRKELFIQTAMKELFESSSAIKKYAPADRILNMGTGIDYFDIVGCVGSRQDVKNIDWASYTRRSYSVVEELARDFNIEGNFTVNAAACVASTQAMGLSYRMLKENKGTACITGGFDSMLSHIHYMGFYKLGALSDWEGEPGEACRPFDKKRRGLVLGEGGVAYLLQNEEEANPEDILAEIAGYSTTTDSYLVTDPDPTGSALAKAAGEAIADAGLAPADIDCVHLHGTGTEKNELAETKAMELVFQERYTEIPAFSLKGQIGHLIGACGAMEILGAIYSLKNQEVPPTVNFEEADPRAPLRIIKDKPLKTEITNILKLNAAFGGQNTAFVLRRYEKR
ncbi:MAG: beta-ketoacyl-[acyl-carrier-protein] synthase family protein [bacterium]|nr:beta-ketoacyl-[acyl-carrier-protein] synthase family protein [bacterium]